MQTDVEIKKKKHRAYRAQKQKGLVAAKIKEVEDKLYSLTSERREIESQIEKLNVQLWKLRHKTAMKRPI